MVHELPFSRRHETRRPAEGLIYQSVPDRVRDGLVNVLMRLGAGAPFAVALFRGLDRVPRPYVDIGDVETLLRKIEWDEFCDAVEVIGHLLRSERRDDFSNAVNELFARHYFGYELRDGQIERVGARVHEEAIAGARGILRDPDLSGPDEQYQKAIGFFNRRPEPDCENCVKEAVSAVEGVARVLLGDPKIVLSGATKLLPKRKDVHPTLVKLLDNLYAYRGDAEGVGHARTGDKEVRIEEAEFVLGVSASAIVYLARLYGRGVE